MSLILHRMAPFLLLLAPANAWAYGYTREEDPLLKAFQVAVRSAREGDLPAAKAQVERVKWQTDELKSPADLKLDFAPRLAAAHDAGATEARVVEAWANLVYLALLQKFHWNLQEELKDYHKAKARLDSAQAYYELALAGNVKEDDRRRREQDPKAPSRHEDVVRQLEKARQALGTPGLFGVGAKPPDPAAFREATVRIAGHLNAVFPSFARPGPAAKESEKQEKR